VDGETSFETWQPLKNVMLFESISNCLQFDNFEETSNPLEQQMKSIIFLILIAFSSVNANAELIDFFKKMGDEIKTLTPPKNDVPTIKTVNKLPSKKIEETNNQSNEISNSNARDTYSQLKVKDTINSQSSIQNPEKILLSDAISHFASITQDLPSKDRLRLYEIGLQKIDKITQEYGATDLGLILKSTGKFGDLDIKKIQQTYMNCSYIMIRFVKFHLLLYVKDL